MPGFGDPDARVLVLGLAPAAHGANRTGRVFTGDGTGGSGDFLMTAMHSAGFANITTSQRADDGLMLTDAYIAAAVRCAPPDNKPTPAEILACHPFLVAEVAALARLRVIVALGKIGFEAAWRLLEDRGISPERRPLFGHGLTYQPPGGPAVIASYHPSRQNTNTKKLTPEMLASVFATARASSEPLRGDSRCHAAIVSTAPPAGAAFGRHDDTTTRRQRRKGSGHDGTSGHRRSAPQLSASPNINGSRAAPPAIIRRSD